MSHGLLISKEGKCLVYYFVFINVEVMCECMHICKFIFGINTGIID